MPLLLISRDDPTKPDSPFTVWVKGNEGIREKAPCIDEAVGALVRKNYSLFRRLMRDARIAVLPEDCFAYLKNCAADVFGYGYNADCAIGAMIRLHQDIFKTRLVLRGETNGHRKPR
jgi:hypothetical protein